MLRYMSHCSLSSPEHPCNGNIHDVEGDEEALVLVKVATHEFHFHVRLSLTVEVQASSIG